MVHALLLLAPLAHAECPEPASASALQSAVGGAHSAFATMDIDSFEKLSTQARELLPCLGEPLAPPDAASYHRMEALAAYIQKDQEATLSSFRASLAVQPSYALPSSVAPEGNPIDGLYDQAREAGDGEVVELSVPGSAVFVVDGNRSSSQPQERPSIVQISSSEGQLLWTGLVPPGGEVPTWESLGLDPTVPPVTDLSNAVALPGKGPSVPLLAGAGASAAAAAGLYMLSFSLRSKYDDPDNPDVTSVAELDALQRKTNASVLGAAGAGVVAVGLGTVAFISVRF